MTATALDVESLSLLIEQEIHVNAPLEATFDALLEQLRKDGILYDRSSGGEFFHVPTEAFRGRFSFEIVQRVGDYAGHGESNAPAFLAADANPAIPSWP